MKYAFFLASCLLAAPALAQDVSSGEAQRLTNLFRQQNPLGYEVFISEVKNGLTVVDLHCQSGQFLPCDPEDVMLTPQGITVSITQAGDIYPVPSDHASPEQDPFNRMVSPGPRTDEELRKEIMDSE